MCLHFDTFISCDDLESKTSVSLQGNMSGQKKHIQGVPKYKKSYEHQILFWSLSLSYLFNIAHIIFETWH